MFFSNRATIDVHSSPAYSKSHAAQPRIGWEVNWMAKAEHEHIPNYKVNDGERRMVFVEAWISPDRHMYVWYIFVCIDLP